MSSCGPVPILGGVDLLPQHLDGVALVLGGREDADEGANNLMLRYWPVQNQRKYNTKDDWMPDCHVWFVIIFDIMVCKVCISADTSPLPLPKTKGNVRCDCNVRKPDF
jgi:hypothetical protein